MAVAEAPVTEAEAFDRLANDWPLYAEKVCNIADPNGQLVALRPRYGQIKLWEALKQQRDEGKPMRARILKARRIGFSTLAQSLLLQRATTRPNHHSYTVAHDRETSGELFAMADLMYSHLPDGTPLKPPISGRRRKQELAFGERAKAAREMGRRGIDSWMRVDTANELEAGRGLGIHSLHCSEVAFWRDAKVKLRGLMQTVPDHPDTVVIQESTANGYNYWRELWERDDDFAKVFVGWWEEPSYRQEFADDDERDQFVASIGNHPDYAPEEEADLVDRFGLEPEQLKWRRWAIKNKAEGDIRSFWQEYPAFPEQAFLSTGQKVFDPVLVDRVIREVEQANAGNPPDEGLLKPKRTQTRRTSNGTVDVPQDPFWVPRREAGLMLHEPAWLIWEHPIARDETNGVSEGRYILACDVASEEENEAGDSAYHAIEVIEHGSERQVAEFRSKNMDAYELAVQCVLAALYYNRAWIAVEVTGHWGAPAARLLHREFKYPFLYTHKSLERGKEKFEDRLGFDTTKTTKRFLIDDSRQDLREWTHGIRSPTLAHEYSTLVKDRKGMAAPEAGAHADLFMAHRIAKRVAQEKPVRPDRKPGHTTSTATSRSPRRMGR